MKKKIFSSLSAFILLFGLTTSALASPVTPDQNCGPGTFKPCLDRG